MTTVAPAIVRYLLIDNAGPRLRLVRLTGPSGHSSLRRQIELLTHIAADLDGYPMQVTTSRPGRLIFLALANSDTGLNDQACRLLRGLGHDAVVRGPLAICSVRPHDLSSLNRRQVGTLLLNLRHPGGHQQPRAPQAAGTAVGSADCPSV